ncbi:MAG: DNA polymerase III subunit beta [Halanaerobiaceae bacterium]
MKFTIEQNELNQGINNVQRAVAKKNTMPILKGIYLEAHEKKGLHLIATDLELGIECWIPADIIESGAIVLPANYLTSIIRELPNEKINFKVDLNNYQADIKCLSSEFNINGYDPDEFPQLPEVKNPQTLNINSSKFKQIINEVKFSISNDESQPALTGSLIEIKENNLTMVSTNTYRLAYSKTKLEEKAIKSDELTKIILPGNTLNELSRLLPDKEKNVEILINSNYSRFCFNDINIISRLIEGKFPNYQQVIPEEYNTTITVNRRQLQHAVKRASLIARENSNIISLSTNSNILIINSLDSDAGKAHEEVEINKEGPEQNINIDAGYLLDIFSVLGTEKISINLIGPLNPLTIKQNNDYIYLIMPIRQEN